MEDIFYRLGFSSPEAGVGTLFILVIILFVICIALIIGVITLLVRKKDFSRNITGISRKQMQRSSGRSSGGRVTSDRFHNLEKEQKDLTININDLYRKAGRAYQKTGIVKYNAYSNMSGNVSFVIAMLDGNNSGFILNVINGREGSSIYIKDITNAQSNERLGTEEIEALKIAVSGGNEEI